MSAVEQQLNDLPEKTRRIFRLNRLEYHSVKEISSQLNAPNQASEADQGKVIPLPTTRHRWLGVAASLAPDNAANLQDYHVLHPIPQTQLDAVTNKAEFMQNVGYQ